jgi:alpha-1,3/alpha-1,6-mannosyltransferase
MSRALRVAFIHPNLGIGGAERLVVDAATYLQSVGHQVTIFTTHHDPRRCFEETRNGTLPVRVYGDFLPDHVGQHLRAPCAIARMAYLATAVALRGERYDVIFCDLVSHVIPILRLFHRGRIMFYCHYPDKLLVSRRARWYRWYRGPIDAIEQWATGMADRVLVNSRFTAAAFRRAFPKLGAVETNVLQPGVDMARYQSLPIRLNDDRPSHDVLILSVGRYHPTKNLALAVRAFALLCGEVDPATLRRLRLVLAGGYDEQFQNEREVARELRELARRGGIEERVTFLRSPAETERLALLARCRCVVHTMTEEHFGLVPLEAMAAGRAVVAVDNGGPAETILHEQTGILCPPTPEAFAAAMARLVRCPELAERMGRAGQARAAAHFSRAAFGARLERLLEQLVTITTTDPPRGTASGGEHRAQ